LPYVNSYIGKNWVYGTLVVNDKVELNNAGFIGAYSDASILAKFGQDTSVTTNSKQLLIENNASINYLGIRAVHNNIAHNQPITFQYYGGNVGFGQITEPTELVDVGGGFRLRGAFIDSTGSAGTDGQVLKNVAGLPVWSNP